ncbi:protein VACUOLELESS GAMETOPHYTES-like isoform X2 [Rhododendron vialii]|nr:protein VACUOLELESS GAMETOPHYTES-like isoform X2 [Rhododendron vialii]
MHIQIDSKRESVSSKRELSHFSHKNHRFIFEEHNNVGTDLSCYGCEQPIWGPTYWCIWCNFYLHQSCAELPQELRTHPIHSHHPLTLLAHPPNGETICHCSTCGKKCERFFYSCYKCSFNIDIVCLSAMDMIHHTIKHESHNHQLIHVQRPALFFCLACGTEHRGASYLCTTCRFWVNQICASLPRTVKYHKHHHQLALSYSLPDEHYQFRPDCDICSGKLSRMHWVYLCVGCRYFAHVNCATSKAEPFRDCEIEVESKNVDPKLIRLPLADQSVDPLLLFIKHIGLQGKYKKASEVTHISHDHPLVFADNIINEDKLPLMTEERRREN